MESVYQALTEGLRAAGGGEAKVYRKKVADGGRGRRRIFVITDREKDYKGEKM